MVGGRRAQARASRWRVSPLTRGSRPLRWPRPLPAASRRLPTARGRAAGGHSPTAGAHSGRRAPRPEDRGAATSDRRIVRRRSLADAGSLPRTVRLLASAGCLLEVGFDLLQAAALGLLNER